MLKAIFTNACGESHEISWNKPDDQGAELLKRARKFYFGIHGTINYRDLVAECKGSTIRVVKQ